MARRHPSQAGRPLVPTPPPIPSPIPRPVPVPVPRLTLLSTAVELGVDREDVTFETEEERHLWEELEREFHAFVSKIGPVWIAD